MLKRLELFNSNRPIDVIQWWRKEGALLLDPPYQRGDVWGTIRRVNLIRSILLHIPIPSIILNDRLRAGWKGAKQYHMAVIDGRQRLTTILMFLDDELEVPGEWFGYQGQVRFSGLEIVDQRKFRNMPLAFSEGTLKTLKQEKEVFELVNFGGVPQGESDLE